MPHAGRSFLCIRRRPRAPWAAHGDKELKNDEEIALWLLDAAHVAAVAGTPFGAPGYLRFSYACSLETIDEGLSAVRRAIAKAPNG